MSAERPIGVVDAREPSWAGKQCSVAKLEALKQFRSQPPSFIADDPQSVWVLISWVITFDSWQFVGVIAIKSKDLPTNASALIWVLLCGAAFSGVLPGP